jgi:hypothetical protein
VPITDHYPTTEHFFRSSPVLHFEGFKMFMGALPQALQIIFEMQRMKK